MRRAISATLEAWKNKKKRKPLLIRGARQVGKTWATRQLGKEFENFVEINFEASPKIIALFAEHFSNPHHLVQQLDLVLNVKITERKTLLFLDEIQVSKYCLLALRYFYEKMPELHVIAAGSLIEFMLSEVGMPVGRIEYIYMYPLNFREFLEALGEEKLLTLSEKSLSLPLCKKLEELLKTYFFIGGMPEVVDQYIEDKNLVTCAEIQAQIINTYRDDFLKYSKNNLIPHVQKIFDSIPRFLSTKFKYSNVDDHIQSRELKAALSLLVKANIALQCTHTSGNGVPLNAESDIKKFKVFFLDIGLALNLLGIRVNDYPLLKFESLVNKGGLAEQFVAQELISRQKIAKAPELFYWHREEKSSTAEIDFLIAEGEKVIPIEVKSGTNKGKKSLAIFMEEKKSSKALLLSLDHEFSTHKKVKYEPLFYWALGKADI